MTMFKVPQHLCTQQMMILLGQFFTTIFHAKSSKIQINKFCMLENLNLEGTGNISHVYLVNRLYKFKFTEKA